MRAHSLGRRQFVQGLAATGMAGGIVGTTRRAHAAETLGGLSVLRGPAIDLTLAAMPVNITGRPRTATVVNQTMPGPLLWLREGDDLTIRVHNHLPETSSIHWHGLKLPNPMDGVPGLTFAGIEPGTTFVYRFPLIQAGTYWYHSHSGMQEQTGLQGALIIDPIKPGRLAYDREYIVQLADWTDEDPMTVIANLKQQGSYYNYHQRTLGTFVSDVERDGFEATLKDRLMWGGMRMDPTDIADVSGSLFTCLVNGLPPAANWTALFRPGERVRLRFINGASMTIFDVRIPGLMLSIVQADGTDVEPVEVEEFRIAAAETYDVIVTPGDGAYTIFAQSIDRSGYARGTLTSRPGQIAPVPAMDPPPLRSMADMGMAHASDHAEMDHAVSGMDGMSHGMSMGHMPGMDHTPGMDMGAALAPQTIPSVNASGVDPARLAGQPFVESVAAQPTDRLGEAGTGLDGNGRKNLRYSQLRALTPAVLPLVPTRAIVFHLTGNMERWVWGFDGKTFSDAPPVRVALGETVRFVLINDTMMEHPIHLHGFLFTLENGQGARQPLKHTVNVKPAEKVAFVFKADVPGHWAFHCHLLYHMEMGMFRTVLVA